MEITISQILIDTMKELNSSLEFPIVLEKIFKHLQQYFPLEGIALNKFVEEENRFKILYFVTKNKCFNVDKSHILNEKQLVDVKNLKQDYSVRLDIGRDFSMFSFVEENYLPYLMNKNPSILTMSLSNPEIFLGSIAFFSQSGQNFTEEDKKIFALLREPFTSAMINSYHYNELQKSRQHLLQENIALKKSLIDDNKIIGNSKSIKETLKVVRILAKQNVQVLILGETGTGKELFADMIFQNSQRNESVFIKVNCGAIPESLIDSELFGYEKGAFTGAYQTKKGYFEQADGGTLFLDEVGELSLQAQVRLLRVLQFGLVERVGGKQSVPVNVRIIAATNRNLEQMLQKGTFREDLYYRLQAFPIHIPPLRKRKQDIPLLLRHFTKKIANRLGRKTPEIDSSNIEKLQSYSWPGNIRELENLVERSIILIDKHSIDFSELLTKDPLWYLEGEVNSSSSLKELVKNCLLELREEMDISKLHTEQAITIKKDTNTIQNKSIQFEVNTENLSSIDDFMRMQIIKALTQSKGKVSGKNSASEILNLNPNTLRKRMQKLNITGKKLWD